MNKYMSFKLILIIIALVAYLAISELEYHEIKGNEYVASE